MGKDSFGNEQKTAEPGLAVTLPRRDRTMECAGQSCPTCLDDASSQKKEERTEKEWRGRGRSPAVPSVAEYIIPRCHLLSVLFSSSVLLSVAR
jgi:hypothetical protein